MDVSALRNPRLWHYGRVRQRLAGRVIAGEGIEIGALHSPFPTPADAVVRYLDRFTTAGLREEYPELAELALVEVDLIDDGESLATLADESQDFVIASHVLEHCEDPIGTLKAHLRVLRTGGTLLLALPDRRHGIDRTRQPTTLQHLLADHEDGGESSRGDHYRDWVYLVDLPLGNVEADAAEQHALTLQERRYSIHFHCWTATEFTEQMAEIFSAYELPARIVEHRQNHHEFLVAVRKTGPLGALPLPAGARVPL